MANSIDFPERNFVYKKPAGWADEQCHELPVWKGTVPLDNNGNHVTAIISKWQLTAEELAQVAETGVVWLQIITPVQPPVAVFAEKPFQPFVDGN